MVAAAGARAKSGQARDLAMLLFTIDTGCRAGEVAGLRKECLNLERFEALVDGKTGPRMVDFTHKTAKVLRQWLSQHPAPQSDYVFVGLHTPNKGNPIAHGTLYQVFRRLAKEAGVKGRFNPHSIRHLVGQVWADHTNLELVRQKLGHRDISTTAIYANQDRTRVKQFTEAIRILD
jgi:integrase